MAGCREFSAYPYVVRIVKWNGKDPHKVSRRKTTDYTLNYVLGGSTKYYIDGRLYPMKKGDVAFIRKGVWKEAHREDSTQLYGYSVHFDLVDGVGWPEQYALPITFSPGVDAELSAYFNRLTTEWFASSSATPLLAPGLLMVILGFLYERYSDPDYKRGAKTRHFRRIRQLILEHYDEPLTTADIATALDLSPSYLGNYFRRTTGYTIRDYINRIRVNKARDLLMTGNYSVTEVAARCGFPDPFYFSKVFKRHTGVPPSELKG